MSFNNSEHTMKHARLGAVMSIVAVVAMCAFIFFMSAEPADQSDELSLGVVWRIVSFIVPGYGDLSPAEQLDWQKMLNHPVRKTAHFLEYATLGALMFNMLMQIARLKGIGFPAKAQGASGERRVLSPRLLDASHKRSFAVLAWALTTLYASSDEVHQMFVSGRAGMVTDVLLDSSGALVGVLLCWLVFFRAR